jgi:RNA polymerase sigma-70 factor (ECF subfamily)
MTDETVGQQRAALVRLAQGGDVGAIEALARQCGRAVYAVALAHLGRPADAEDVAQTVLLAALENIDDCRQPERFDAWLLSIARNRSRRAIVRNRLREVFSGDAEVGGDGAEAAEPVDGADRQLVLRALGSLAARPREVVLLHDLEGYTHSEIAHALSITEESSRQHLSRARKQMRALLEEPAP